MTVWAGGCTARPRVVTVTTPEGCPPVELRSDRLAERLGDALGVPGDALCVRDRVLDPAMLLGRPPLLDGVSVRLVERARWTPPRISSPVAATEIAVIGGPDAGRTRALTAGAHTVGRSGADLTIADPTLTRLHLRLDVGPAGVTVTDLGSENGTRIDGLPHPGGSARVGVGAVLGLGHTTLTLRPTRVRPVTTTPRGDGTMLVARSPLPLPEPPEVRIQVPTRPERPPPRRVPWPAALIPLPVAGVLAWLLGPHLLLLAMMSPLMVMATFTSDRIGARKTYALALRAHAGEREDCERQRDSALDAERVWRERTCPDLAAIARAATTPGSLLWSRTTGASPTVRLGRATVESRVSWAEDGSARRLPLTDAPVALDLTTYAGLAVSGPLADRVVDGVIGQLCALHSPRDLVVWTDRRAWAPVPHTRLGTPAALLSDAVATLRRRCDAGERQPGSRAAPTVVVVVDGATLCGDDVEALTALLREGPESHLHIVLVGDSPSLVATRLETAPTGSATLTRPHRERLSLTVDAAAGEWVGRVVAALAPLRDTAGRSEDLPAQVTLADALARSGTDPCPAGPARAWSEADNGAWVTLGVDQTGAYRLDLATAGPHALIGGTTGSGKSELLRTLVVSLAAAHPPEDVSVVLIDYKGGSAFTGLQPLPHIVGVVTDLDSALTARALASLRAEIHRRESLLARCGATDILTYREHSRRPGSDLPHLARLVIVVDEFRALADELPGFVTGLVRLAAVGRSLGVHLVLATQRPAGVVTADMRANLGLRIALRVRDRTDSQDVIESDAAARLSRLTPGRALVRCGAEPLIAFQVATVDPPDVAAGVGIDIAWSDGTSTRRHYPVAEAAPSVDLVRSIADAARRGHHRAPASPWLPPLPDSLAWHDGLPAAAWALRDDPDRQRQDVTCLDPARMAHTAIAGAIGSGRTTTLQTMVAATVAADGASTHLYVLADPSGALAALAGLPHTGALVDRSDPAQVTDLVDRLVAEVRARRSVRRAPRLIVVVDGWDVLAEACDDLDHGALTDRLLALLREGYAVGVRAIVTGDRSVLTGRVGRTLPERILLRPADVADLALAGVPPTGAPGVWPPGRAVRVADRAELQVLLRPVDGVTADPPAAPPWRLAHLPVRIALDSLPPTSAGSLAIGLSSEPTAPLSVGQPGRRRVVVVGSAGAGRTATLATIGVQAARAGRRVCLVEDHHSPLADVLRRAGVCVERLGWDDGPADLVTLRRAHRALVVLADDVDRHAESPLVPVLIQIADLADREGGLVAVAGEGAALAMRPRGVGSAVARGRFGIVLGAPTPLDGDLLGTRLPKVRDVLPGRGWLVAERRAVPIQVAHPFGGDAATEVPSVPSIPRRPRRPR
jgi:DNA segregation ATPase FtsK/SpoIIIE, S-DNA-T family